MIAEELLTVGAQKMVFIELARKLFPAFLAGILMAAIMAASMSTADSQLLVASSSFTSDIYKPVIKKNASEKEVLWVGRLVVLAVAVIAFFIASSKGEGAQAIMNMVENAWAGFGSAFGPVILLSYEHQHHGDGHPTACLCQADGKEGRGIGHQFCLNEQLLPSDPLFCLCHEQGGGYQSDPILRGIFRAGKRPR